MKCPKCGEDDNVVAQTYSDLGFMMPFKPRTRLCQSCGWYFDTEERVSSRPYRLKNRKRIFEGEHKHKTLFDEE